MISPHHREDVVLGKDHVLDAVELHFVARVLADEDLVARLDLERADLAVLLHLAAAHRDDFGLDGLLLRGVGDDDASLGLFFLLEALDDDSVSERTDLHGVRSSPAGLSVVLWHSTDVSASAAEAKRFGAKVK